MDHEFHKRLRLLGLERDALHNKLFGAKFCKKIEDLKDGIEELNKNQQLALMIIGTIKEVMPSEIGTYLAMDRSSLSRMVFSLEKKGFLKRRNDLSDRRKVLVSLTEKGRKDYEVLNRAVEERLSEVMEVLNEQDLKDFEECLGTQVRIMRKINDAMS
ncbi:MAG: MarR family transcriptional regulator [Methanosarcinaceae archaeon]|nr:MarR family transcriptional regulator [Methanosarcinaceae archaeon]MDD4497104.1 MarR family transcriptional regulator [Methanosarcinaceae archaeon]